MIEEREVISMALGWAVLLFAIWHRRTLRCVVGWPLLFAAYALLAVSWTASVVEGFLWEPGLNMLQHTSSTASAILFAGWCLKGRDDERPGDGAGR